MTDDLVHANRQQDGHRQHEDAGRPRRKHHLLIAGEEQKAGIEETPVKEREPIEIRIADEFAETLQRVQLARVEQGVALHGLPNGIRVFQKPRNQQ